MRVSRWEPTQSSAGLCTRVEINRAAATTLREFRPASLICATIGSAPQRPTLSSLPKIPNGAPQNASRPRTTLTSEPNDREPTRRQRFAAVRGSDDRQLMWPPRSRSALCQQDTLREAMQVSGPSRRCASPRGVAEALQQSRARSEQIPWGSPVSPLSLSTAASTGSSYASDGWRSAGRSAPRGKIL